MTSLGSDLAPLASRLAHLPRAASWLGRAHASLLLIVFFVPAAFVAVVLPYRAWDSMAFGYWSRLIETTGNLFPGGLGGSTLGRPLFYVEQGLLWRAFGHHEWLGRLLSLAFAVGFALALWVLASRLAARRDAMHLAVPAALGVALASSVFATHAASGMSDMPVAATAAVTAAVVWSRVRTSLLVALTGLAALATVLAKPSGLVAVAGVAAASVALLWNARRRLVFGLAGLALGAAGGLVYDAVQAHRLHTSLPSLLRSGNGDFYLSKGAAARADQLLRASWLGDAPRLLVLFGLVYAVTRVVGGRQRVALAVAAPAALVWSIVGPLVADGSTPYPFAHGLSMGLVAWLLLAGVIVAAPFLEPGGELLGRRAQAALLLWIIPGAASWLVYRSDDVRFLSPVWAPLALLAAAGAATVAYALRRVRPVAAVVPPLALTLLVAGNVTSIDNLRASGWHDLLHMGPSGWSSRAVIDNYAYGPFSYELDLLRANVGSRQTIVTSDGRLAYFFPQRVDERYAESCSELAGARAFVLLLGDESVDIMERIDGSTANPLAWAQCTSPRLHIVGEQAGIYTVFVSGVPSRAAVPSDCHLSSYPGQLLDGILGENLSYPEAKALRAEAVSMGYASSKVEQTNCDSFRVVVTGVPEPKANQADFLEESIRAGFKARIEAPERWPEVPTDVVPARAITP
jgi:hypothetical protein